MSLRIVFVCREVYPFGGGGLGASVTALARCLAPVAEVSIITTDLHEERFYELKAARDQRLPPGVRFAFAREPDAEDSGSYFNYFHVWSARAFEALKNLYPDGGPQLVEFADFLGEGAVTVQARRTADPDLRHMRVLIRNCTSHEMCDVLNGHLTTELGMRSVYDLERYALRHADHMIWPGGDVLETYRRFYGEGLAEPLLVRHAVDPEGAHDTEVTAGGALRMIYVGRLERRKGVENLLRAVTGLSRDDWSLTLLGGDTPTAPLGNSMRLQLELMAGEDPRIRFHPPVGREDLFGLLAEHDLAVYPSLWECWPFVALHAFEQNTPVLATPTGGFTELVEPGASGWLVADTTESSLLEGIEQALDSRAELERMVESRGPRRAFERMTEPESIREAYVDLAGRRRRAAKAYGRAGAPLVSAVVPYFRMHEHVEDTIVSLLEQTYAPLEILLVNDGSFEQSDWVVGELAARYPITVLTQRNSGLGAARNFGIGQSRGRYVFPVDADNVAHPIFVARCVDVLENEPDVAYVNCWVRYVDEDGTPLPGSVEGYQPVSNDLRTLEDRNAAGDAAAVIRRRLFDLGHWYSQDLTSYEDWLFFRRLARAGLYGHAIPERLVDYRVREASMVREIGHRHHEWLLGELEAHVREAEVQWMP